MRRPVGLVARAAVVFVIALPASAGIAASGSARAAFVSREMLLAARAGSTTWERVLSAGQRALELESGAVSADLRTMIEQEARNVRTSRALLDALDEPNTLNAVAAVVRSGTLLQAAAIDRSLAALPTPDARMPSEAIRSLARAHGLRLMGAELGGVLSLDRLPPVAAGRVARFIDDFARFEEAARNAFADVDAGPSERMGRERGSIPSEHELGTVMAARISMLDGAVDLMRSLETLRSAPPVRLPPLLSVDFRTTDDRYEDDFALLLDGGGDDTYHNNAGGASTVTCPLRVPPALRGIVAASLVDFAGHDRYANDEEGCVNGGAEGGAGFLLDLGGDDEYLAGGRASNGGGAAGAGFLLDSQGNDHYVAGYEGTNGGASAGVGFLADLAGADTYEAGGNGTNGGSHDGSGFLLDAGAANDVYRADGGHGINGGGDVGAGFLLDGGGDDRYEARGDPLQDRAGGAMNGGGAEGPGFLLDVGGDDAYVVDGFGGANGGGHLGIGVLLDGAGDDAYLAGGENGNVPGDRGSNGGGHLGRGNLIDLAGNDTYTAGSRGTNGGGYGGVGMLFDAAGDDVYVARCGGTNGGGQYGEVTLIQVVAVPAGTGLLLDGAGADVYSTNGSAFEADQTAVPKGTGAQIDMGGDSGTTASEILQHLTIGAATCER